MTQGRVLLTGATGFVGGHVLRALAEIGVPVRAVIRSGSGARLPACPGDIEIVESGDLFSETPNWWVEVCEGVDCVAHLAWIATPGRYLIASENIDCLRGTLSLAKGAAEAKVRLFLGVGTCFEYDLSGGELSIANPLGPSTPYAGAKAAAFLSLSQWLPPQGVAFVWARLFYLYGEGEHPSRLVPYLRSQLAAGERVDLTSGRQIRDFLDVKDAAAKLVSLLNGDVTGAYNVCSGTPITVRALAECIAMEFGRPDLLNFGARPDNLVDPPFVLGLPGQALPESPQAKISGVPEQQNLYGGCTRNEGCDTDAYARRP
jgi:nucleoside-diphosphate-sugar epimerase